MSKRSKGINNKKTTEMQVKRMNKVNRNKHYINYFAALLLFGSNGFVAEKISMDSYGIVFWRVAVGLAAILIILFIKRRQDQKEQKAAVSLRRACHRHIAYNFISGAAQGISWLFLFEAYSRAGVGLSTLIYYFGPALVMALSPLVFKESFTGKKAVCFAAVLCGMLLVNKQSGSGNDFTGILFAAISAVFFALMMIFNKKATSVTGISNAMIQLAGALPVTLIFAVFKGGIPVPQSMEDFFLIIIIGAVNTGLGIHRTAVCTWIFGCTAGGIHASHPNAGRSDDSCRSIIHGDVTKKSARGSSGTCKTEIMNKTRDCIPKKVLEIQSLLILYI